MPERRAGTDRRLGLAGSNETIVIGVLRELLRIRSAQQAASLLQQAARDLGGSISPATEAPPDALPIDLSLGEGPPVLATAGTSPADRHRLDEVLPRLVEDARHAIDMLRHTERLEVGAHYDQLTGLANRRVLERLMPRVDHGVMVMVDLDHFKAVNDTHGHAVGDEVLAAFGQLLLGGIRASDTVCRIGGEEFVIVAENSATTAAVDMIERLRVSWTASAPLPITFSAGIAIIDAGGAAGALLAADRALYRAKEGGRNRTEIAFGEGDATS